MKILYLLPGLLCDETVWEHQREHLSDIAEIRIPNFKGFDSLTHMGQSVLDEAAGDSVIGGYGNRAAADPEIAGVPEADHAAIAEDQVEARSRDAPNHDAGKDGDVERLADQRRDDRHEAAKRQNGGGENRSRCLEVCAEVDVRIRYPGL